MANENDYIPEGSGPSGQVQQGDDLKAESKDTLGSYLSNLTTAANTQNNFPVEDISRVETSLQGPAGLPATFETGGQDSNPGFTRNFSSDPSGAGAAVSNFETLSDSGNISSLGTHLNKNSQTDGHTLLTDFISNREANEPGMGDPSGQSTSETPSGAPPIQQKISNMLRNGNRFDPTPGSSPYIEDGRFTEPGIPIEQGQFGIYDDDAVRTTLAELHKIAHSMIVRQTGHRKGDGQDPDGGSVMPATAVQKGSSKISTEKLRALGAFGAPDRASLVNAELRYDDITGAALSDPKSFGALSSYRETFEGAPIKNLNVAFNALIEYLGAAAVFTIMVTLIELLETGAPPHQPGQPNTLKKGYWHKEGGILRLMRKLGIPNLNRPPYLCVIYGLAAFFKLPPAVLPDPSGSGIPIPPPPIPPPFPSGPPTGPMEAIGAWLSMLNLDDTFFNVLYGSGYYANILRVVRRDMDRLLTDISFPSGTPTGPDGARAIFEVLTSLNTYTSWNFFVALLRMGDAWLSSYSKYVRFGDMKMSGQTKQQHSRTPGGQSRLAWRHRSAPALALLNHKYINAARVYGYDPNFHINLHNSIGDGRARSNDSPYWGNLRSTSKGKSRGLFENQSWHLKRESQETRVLIENELDSEYCPFYFHDLRTNEVIGFHAFLSDVKDSYSVSYAESGGYGRIDKVKIYQDTTRSISFSFTMVATSPDDFDSMWWSFNKLISMIYPQFSMGKPVRAGSKKFVMPFSQIPTASPVIRVRIGDLIRSNYSRFNLARLFGLSEVQPAPVGGVSSTPTATGETNPAYANIASAPFDLSATEALESEAAEAAAETAEEQQAIADEMAYRFEEGGEPVAHWDDTVGYLPGHPQWGRAILRPNSSGYTTYDTNSGITVSAGVGSDVAAVKNNHSANPPGAGATHVESTPFKSRPAVAGEVNVFERIVVGPNEGDAVDQDDDEIKEGIHAEYFVQYSDRDDVADPYGPVSEKGHFHTYVVTSADLTPITPSVVPSEPDDATVDLATQITDVTEFFDPNNNAIVRSFEAAGGRGLAGVITSLDFDWGDAQWDMSGIGRRAPTLLNVNISFSPIHDIIPGLDNNGMMRAMNYPVGNIAGPLGTDPVDPGAVQNPAYAMRSSEPGATYPGDASAANYSGFAGSQDDDGEGEGP